MMTFSEIATTVAEVQLFPPFDIASWLVACWLVREDLPKTQMHGTASFTRMYPFASWLSTVLMCFDAQIFQQFLLGESVLQPLTNTNNIIIVTILWYLINYCPYDIAYKISRILPIRLLLYIMRDVARVSYMHEAVRLGMARFPNCYVPIVILGVITGAAVKYSINIQRAIMGRTVYGCDIEFLHPSVLTKASLVASILLLLAHNDFHYISTVNNVHFCILLAFILFDLHATFGGRWNPFEPIDKFINMVLFSSCLRGDGKVD
ncbi:Trimeric intracellular cation channel type 1B.1 [Lamellibrachia satsuma]|nr:Trimeric intracellular cation channel type 1B.1 [Lamellibrachia satsuma]